VLSFSGRRQQEAPEEGERFYAAERSAGTFSRTLQFPDGADLDNVSAEMRDGVLTIHVPKRPEVQPRRITVGRGGNRS